MNFAWDEAKRAGKHGLDFAQVAKLDWENATIIRDDRFPYGEPRFWGFAI